MVKCQVCGIEIPKKISYIRRHYLDSGHAFDMPPAEFMAYLRDEGHWEEYGLGAKKGEAE